MFNTLLYEPLLKVLLFLTNLVQGNFGFAIILLTILIRAALIPLSLPAMRSANKMKSLKPLLDELKKKHAKDKKLLQQKQLELYKEHGVNPAAGCLPTLVQFAILIALYRVFINFLENNGVDSISFSMNFFWLDLSKPDNFYILPVIAGASQLILSKMLMGAREHHSKKDLKVKAQKKEKDSEGSMQDMAEAMQQQMLYVMPVMTVLIALRLPSGLAVYWVTTTLFSLVQQYFVSGAGGLTPILNKFKREKI